MKSNITELEKVLGKVRRLNSLTNDVIREARSHSIDMTQSVGPLPQDFHNFANYSPDVAGKLFDLSTPEIAALSIALNVAAEAYQPIANGLKSFFQSINPIRYFRERGYQSKLNEILQKKQELANTEIQKVKSMESSLRAESETAKRELIQQSGVPYASELAQFEKELEKLGTKKKAYQRSLYGLMVARYLVAELSSWRAVKHTSYSDGPDLNSIVANAELSINSACRIQELQKSGNQLSRVTCGCIHLLHAESVPSSIQKEGHLQKVAGALATRWIFTNPFSDNPNEFKKFYDAFLNSSPMMKEACKKRRRWKWAGIITLLVTASIVAMQI